MGGANHCEPHCSGASERAQVAGYVLGPVWARADSNQSWEADWIVGQASTQAADEKLEEGPISRRENHQRTESDRRGASSGTHDLRHELH